MHLCDIFRRYLPLVATPLGAIAAQSTGDFSPSIERITLAQAIQRATENDPRLELNDAMTEAADGQVEQADLPPNPVVGAEIENFLGTGPISGVQGLEVTLGISQVFETADKRSRRTALAQSQRELLNWKREVTLAELEATVRTAFVETLLAQDIAALREEQLQLAIQSKDATARHVDAAHMSQVTLTRATLAVHQRTIARDKAVNAWQIAQSHLAALWGQSDASTFEVEGYVTLDPELPDFDSVIAQLSSTAQLAQYDALRRSREAALKLEYARATPDFEVFAGGRYYNEANGNFGFVAGVEVPWPMFNKNQGNIRTARAELRAVEHEREAERRLLMRQLNQVYQALSAAHAEAKSIQNTLIPSAQQTLADTKDGFERGQFTQLAVLESRQMLAEMQEAYLEALARYAKAQTELQALTRPVIQSSPRS